MSLGHSRKKAASWPFWLLVAAWWCANSPQAATFELVLWVKGAASFSHQAKLSTEVAAILRGEAQSPTAQFVNVLNRSAPAAPVSIPAQAAIKRVELGLETVTVRAPRSGRAELLALANDCVPARCCCPPRLRPPRLA